MADVVRGPVRFSGLPIKTPEAAARRTVGAGLLGTEIKSIQVLIVEYARDDIVAHLFRYPVRLAVDIAGAVREVISAARRSERGGEKQMRLAINRPGRVL